MNAFDVGNFYRAREAGEQAGAGNVLSQYGAKAMQGDPTALNALASNPHTLGTAMQMQDRQAAAAERKEQLAMARQRISMAAAEQARKQSADETRQDIHRALGMRRAADAGDWATVQMLLSQEEELAQFDITPQNFEEVWPLIEGAAGAMMQVYEEQAQHARDYQDPLAKLRAQAYEANLQPGTPEYRQFMANGGRAGGRAVFDGEGNPLYLEGDVAGMAIGFGTKATNEIEGSQIDSGRALSRLTTIQNSFKPEYLQIQNKAGVAWANLKDRVGQSTPEDQRTISDYTSFAVKTFNHLNTTLKEISGAAVNEHEMVRLKQELPNPGAGVFDGDSPTQFESKLKTSIALQRAALIRYSVWEARGSVGNPWDIGTLDEMPQVVAQLSRQFEEAARGAGLTDDQAIRSYILNRLQNEYGIGSGQ